MAEEIQPKKKKPSGEEKASRCNNNPFCQSLDPETKDALCKLSSRACFKPRQVIEVDARPGGKLLLLDKGQAIPVRLHKDGKQKGIECLRPGELVGISQLFSPDKEHGIINLYVKESIEACLLPVAQFEHLCDMNANLAKQIIKNLSRRFAAVINQLECMTLGSGEERVLFLVQSLGTDTAQVSLLAQTLAFTHEEIALLAGINRVTATRVIDQLKQSGTLSTGRGKLKVLRSEPKNQS